MCMIAIKNAEEQMSVQVGQVKKKFFLNPALQSTLQIPSSGHPLAIMHPHTAPPGGGW